MASSHAGTRSHGPTLPGDSRSNGAAPAEAAQRLRVDEAGGTSLAALAEAMNAYHLFAAGVDLVHASSMLLWGLGLPLLVWHRFPRLSRGYMWFAATFVVITVASQEFLGECVLTSWARALWNAGGGYRDGTPFMARLANAIAGLRPSRRAIVLVWEIAVLLTSLGSLWCWHQTRPRAQNLRLRAQRR